jgi:histidinol-phosphate aminotransferase
MSDGGDDPRLAPLRALVPGPLRAMPAYHVPRPDGVRAKLDANELPWSLPDDVRRGLADELARVALERYPIGDGGELRDAVADDLGVAAGSLVFGNGSDELIALLYAAFAEPRPGASRAAVLYPSPTFVVYRIAALAHGLEPLEIPLDAEMQMDAAAVERALSAHRPNLALFALPNNPTGTLWDVDAVLAMARRHPDVLIVSDEAYIEYGGRTLMPHLAELPNLIVMRTLSKIGLAGLRVGFVIAHPALVAELEKVRPPYNVGALNQRAATWLLRNHAPLLRARCRDVIAERERLAPLLRALPDLHVFESRANLFLVRVATPGDNRATTVWNALASRGILVRNFDRPGPLSGCLRITVGTPAENDLLLAALGEILRDA